MADIDPGDIKDVAATLQTMAASIQDLVGNLSSTNNETQKFSDLLESAVLNMKDLPGHITNGRDLWKEMTKDSKTLKKTQEEITKMVKDELNKSLQEASDHLEDINASTDDWNELFAEHAKKEKASLEYIQKYFDLAERVNKSYEQSNQKLVNATELVKSIGDQIRNPAQTADGFLVSLGEIPQKLADARQETGNWGSALLKVGKDGLGSITGPVTKLFAAGGIFLVGIAAATAALTGLFLLWKNYYNWLDKEVIPAQADFNKQIGGTDALAGQLKGRMTSVGVEFQLLGMSFEEGARLVRDFSESYKTIDFSDAEFKLAKKSIAEFGLSAQETGTLMMQFRKQIGGAAGALALKDTFKEAKIQAESFGLPVNTVLRDLGSSPDVLARFGVANRLAFSKSTAVANSYGLSIKDVNKSFGKQLDTFEKSSEVAAKLNTVFGSTINSYELMIETDPTKRMEMLRGELVKQGKEWENLSTFEKNVITQNLGVSESQAALILSSEKERQKLEARQKVAEANARTNERWEEGIGRIKRTLIAWDAELDNVMRSFTRLTAALFGLDKPEKEIIKGTNLLSKGMEKLSKKFDSWANSLREHKQTIKTFWDVAVTQQKVFFDLLTGDFEGAFDKISDLFQNLGITDWFKNLWSEISTSFADQWNGLVSEAKSIWGSFIKWISETVEKLPFFSELSSLASSFTSAIESMVGDTESINDGIITKGGRVIKLNPMDNVYATKSPILPSPAASVSPASISPTTTKIANQRGGPASAGAGGGGMQPTIEPKIEVISFSIDGKQIAEAQVRISRS